MQTNKIKTELLLKSKQQKGNRKSKFLLNFRPTVQRAQEEAPSMETIRTKIEIYRISTAKALDESESFNLSDG